MSLTTHVPSPDLVRARAYDPCISCATHFLDLRIVEDGA